MGAWKMMSFEVLPIIIPIVNSSVLDLSVNGVGVINNTLTINQTEANSFDLTIDHIGLLTFDLRIENATLYYDYEYAYSEVVEFEFEFEQKSSPFTFVTFTQANMTNVPDTFTYYYFNGQQREDYVYDIHTDRIGITHLIGTTYVNLDSFDIELRYLNNARSRLQVTSAPRTDENSVVVSELFLADLDYKYWYFEGDLDLISVESLEHLRTSTIFVASDFNVEGINYQFDMDVKTEENDLFYGEFNINPNFNVTHDVLINNGTYSEVQISYKADIILNNVTIVLDLSSDGLYMANWSLNGNQSTETYILEIPNIEFISTWQSFVIYGNSSIPEANFSYYQNEQLFTISESNYESINVYYRGYLEYDRYSESWIVPAEEDWELDGVHYLDNYYGFQEGYFISEGFDSTITSSYLRMRTNPIASLVRVQGENYVEYTITMNVPAYEINLEYYIVSEDNLVINAIETPTEFITQVELFDHDGVHYYQIVGFNLQAGVNVIRIEFSPRVIWDDMVLLLPIGIGLVGFVVIYYGIKNPEALRKLQFWKKKPKKKKKATKKKKEKRK